jgi:TonB family protein
VSTPQIFELAILPEGRIDRRIVAGSYAFVTLLVVAIINIGLLWPQRLQPAQNYHVTELIPLPSLRPEPAELKPAPVLHAKLLPPAPVFDSPKLVVPRQLRAPRQRAEEAPMVALNNFAPAPLKVPGGARPAQIVHTGEFGSSATPTINAPVQKVQTGGFGDPNGLPGQGKPTAHLVAANIGSFDLPQGAGYGNGAGGGTGLKGTVASAGFGSGIGQPAQGDGRKYGAGSPRAAGFTAQQVAQPGVKPTAATAPATTPVEIISKPKPLYTQEARQLKLEGEVLLEVIFAANGQLHVNRVVRGMGHGLDEAAITAANNMRFKPALRNGQPMDSTVIVHVMFQLAY